MGLLAELYVDVVARTDAFHREMDRVRSSASEAGRTVSETVAASSAAPAAATSGQGSAARTLRDLAIAGDVLKNSLRSALSPIKGVLRDIRLQIDVLGGAMITFADRMDGTVKSHFMNKAVDNVRKNVKDVLRKMGSGKGTPLEWIITPTILMPGSALRTLQADVRDFLSWITSFGGVSGKALSKYGGPDSERAARGSKRVADSLKAVPPAAEAASRSLRGVGLAIGSAFGAGAAIFSTVSFLKGGIVKAMDMNESISKVKHVFKDGANSIIDSAETLAKEFGIPKQTFIDGATSLGRFGKSAGLSEQASADLGVRLAKLAIDLGSIENINTASAMDKLQSALAGQSEPLRKHGAMLTEEAVKQEAVRLGYAATSKEVSEQAKILARVSLVENELADASGDLARTAEEPKNAFRRVSGTMENLAASIGEALMPITRSFIGMLGDLVMALADTFEANKETVRAFAEGFAAAFEGVAIVIRNFEISWDGLVRVAGVAIEDLLAIVFVLPENLSRIGGWIRDNWASMIVDAIDIVSTAFRNLQENLANLASAIVTFLSDPTKGFEFEWTPLLKGFQAATEAMPELVKPQLRSIQAEIDKTYENLVEAERVRLEGKTKRAAEGKTKVDLSGQKQDDKKVETRSLDEYAKKLQEGALGGDTAKKQLGIAREQLNVQRDQLKAAKKAASKTAVAVAGGPK